MSLQDLKKEEKGLKDKKEKDWKWNNFKVMTILEEIRTILSLWLFQDQEFLPTKNKKKTLIFILGSRKLSNFKIKLKMDIDFLIPKINKVQIKICKKSVRMYHKVYRVTHIKKIAMYKKFYITKIKISKI
jgi:hypothetical protein